MKRITPSLVFLLLPLVAGPALAQDARRNWEEVSSSFQLDGTEYSLQVMRADRSAFLFEYHDAPEPGEPGSTVRHGRFGVSKSLFARLEQAIMSSQPAKPQLISQRIMGMGSQGKDVAALQRLLRAEGFEIVEDGVFGPQTRRAVRGYQAKKGLREDGVAGPVTLKAISPRRAPTAELGQGSEIESHRVDEALKLIAMSVLNGGEPRKVTLSGRLVETDHGLYLYKQGGGRVYLSGFRPGMEKAAAAAGEATLDLLLYENALANEGISAGVIQKIRVKVSEASAPVGVGVGAEVEVYGVARKGSRGVVLKVRDPKTKQRGRLVEPNETKPLSTPKQTGISEQVGPR